MKSRICLLGIASLTLLYVSGCSQSADNQPSKQTSKKVEPTLKSTSVVKLLDKSRKELADSCQQELDIVRRKEKIRLTGQKPFSLLPHAHLSVVMPIWREASYSEELGISLPPYLTADSNDKLSAMHLAHHGDADGALKLIDAGDKDTAELIKSLKSKRNYPVEWSRLVALLLYEAELRLADGNPEAAWEILGIHQQLEKLGMPDALRTALMFRGRALLQQAAKAWSETGKKERAEKIDSTVNDWAALTPTPSCKPGCTEAEAVGLFGKQPQGRVLLANDSLRVLDLLNFPIPDEGLGTIAAFFDSRRRLDQILVLYKSVAGEVQGPEQFTALANFTTGEPVDRPLPERTYDFTDFQCDVAIVPNHPLLGGFVRLRNGKPSPATALKRDLGRIHLSRSIRQNRMHVAREQNGSRVEVADPQILSELKRDFATGTLTSVVLERDAQFDVVDRVIFKLKPDADGRRSLRNLAKNLFETSGPPHFRYDKDKAVLSLHWLGLHTMYTLEMPPVEQTYRFVIQDTNRKSLAARFEQAKAWDETERRLRLRDQKGLQFIDRHLEGIGLGMTLAQAEKSAPVRSSTLTQMGDKQVHFLFTDKPLSEKEWKLRQLFARTSTRRKVREIRARYVNAGMARASSLRDKLERRYGAPDAVPDERYVVWNDVDAKPGAAEVLRWHDDLTTLEWRRFGGQIELILHERQPSAEPLPPFAYLPKGIAKIQLGQTRSSLLSSWKGQPKKFRDALLFIPDASSAYAAVLVWFDGDKVSKIVTRHRDETPKTANSAGAAVRRAWSHNMKAFGWPQRQQFLPSKHLQGWGVRDDRTRVRIFWQDGREGKHVYTEWKLLPATQG